VTIELCTLFDFIGGVSVQFLIYEKGLGQTIESKNTINNQKITLATNTNLLKTINENDNKRSIRKYNGE
jgi:hypothetical protein